MFLVCLQFIIFKIFGFLGKLQLFHHDGYNMSENLNVSYKNILFTASLVTLNMSIGSCFWLWKIIETWEIDERVAMVSESVKSIKWFRDLFMEWLFDLHGWVDMADYHVSKRLSAFTWKQFIFLNISFLCIFTELKCSWKVRMFHFETTSVTPLYIKCAFP